MAGWGEEPGLIGRLSGVPVDGLQGSGKQDLVWGSWRLGVEPSAHLSSSQSKAEHGHKVRLAVGSGLRPDTWERFVRRFGPLQVLFLSLHGREQSLHSSARKTLERRACLPGD